MEKFIPIKIDKTTLPEPGRKVEILPSNDNKFYEAVFDEKGVFLGDEDWKVWSQWEVMKWRYID